MSEIHKRLAEIQQALKVPKDLRNDFGKYQYRNASSILAAVKDLLKPNECVTTTAEAEYIGTWNYIKTTATFTSGGESVSSTGFAREPIDRKGMDASQITGAASTYSKKYALEGLFGIDDSRDDPDTTNKHGADEPKAEEVNVTLMAAVSEMSGMRDPAAVEAKYSEVGKRNKSKPWYNDLGLFRDAMLDLLAVTDKDHVKAVKTRQDDAFKGSDELSGQWRTACANHYRRLEKADD